MNTKLLTKLEVLEMLKDTHLGVDTSKRVLIQYIDLTGNVFAPETYAYKVSFCDTLLGERHQHTFYPYTLGLQPKSKLKGMALK